MAGWIRLHRQLENHWIAENNDYFHWWVDMLWMAAFQDIERDGVTIKRGQFEASVSFLTKRWLLNRKTLDRKTVITFLKRLESEQMITRIVTDGKKAIITICNYDKYQYSPHFETDTSSDIIMDTLTDIKTDTIKELINKLKNKIKSPKGDSSDKSDPPKKQDGVDFAGLLDFFNRTLEQAGSVIPRCQSCEGQRQGFVRARIREHGLDAVYEMITKASQSDFLNGKNQSGWIADFTWLFRPSNFQKVLEGNYDNRTNNYNGSNNHQSSGGGNPTNTVTGFVVHRAKN